MHLHLREESGSINSVDEQQGEEEVQEVIGRNADGKGQSGETSTQNGSPQGTSAQDEGNNSSSSPSPFSSTPLIELVSSIPVSLPAPFFPEYAIQFGIDTSMVGWVFGVYTIASFFAGMISLPLLRRCGRVPVLAIGGNVLCIGTLAFCYSNSFLLFMLSSITQGIGCGLISVALCAITSASFEEKDLAFAFGLIEAVLGIACALGPGIGYVFYAIGGFQFPFVISVIISTLLSLCYEGRYTRSPVSDDTDATKALLDEETGNNYLFVSQSEDGDLEESNSFWSLYSDFMNSGFILGAVNIAFNCSVWAVVEPLLEIHFLKYLTLDAYGLGQIFLWPSLIDSVWTLLFVYLCRRYALFEDNMYSIMGVGHLLNGVGRLFLGPVPFFTVLKDSEWAWISQIIGLLFVNVGIGMGVVPSIPTMKKSVSNKGDLTGAAGHRPRL